MFLHRDNLLIDFLNFGRFFGRVDKQLRSLLFQVGQFLLGLVHVFRVDFSQGAGGARSLGGVVLSLGHLAIVFGLE